MGNSFERDDEFITIRLRGPRSSDLVDQTVQDAQGVFLGVRFVIRDLPRGLSSNDNLSDLRKTLRSFLTTLTVHFLYMFDSIDDSYSEETAKLLL